jgi:general stress protein YciG
MANTGTKSTSKRGFAAMDEARQREIASMGGKASGGNFAKDRKKASRAGKKGGETSRRT